MKCMQALAYDSIRPGKKPCDPTVCDIRAIMYKYYKACYKLSFDDDFAELPQKIRHQPKNIGDFPQLFPERLKISKKKYLHLQEIKPKIDQSYWEFYDNLPKDDV